MKNSMKAISGNDKEILLLRLVAVESQRSGDIPLLLGKD